MAEHRRPSAAAGAVLGSIISIQIGAAVATTLFTQVGPAAACMLRLTSAAVILLVVVRPRPWTWTARQRLGVLALGVSLGLLNFSFYQAISALPLATAVALQFLGPLTLAAVLARRWRDRLWVVLAVGGIGLLTAHHHTGAVDVAAVLWALGSGAAWAGYIMSGSKVAATVSSSEGLAGASAVAAVVTLPFGVSAVGGGIEAGVWVTGVLVAVLSSVIPYSLEMYALRHVAAGTFAVLIALEPVAAAAVGTFMLGQTLTISSLAAIALVVTAGIGSVVHAPAPHTSPSQEQQNGYRHDALPGRASRLRRRVGTLRWRRRARPSDVRSRPHRVLPQAPAPTGYPRDTLDGPRHDPATSATVQQALGESDAG